MSFFVLGLPRSRTAWLSVFLSQSGTHCYHDGMNGCNSIAEYEAKIDGCGDSSTCLHLFDVNAICGDAKIVVINKSEDEYSHCVDWIDKTYQTDSRGEMERQKNLLDRVSGLMINQSDIDERLKEIFEYLTGREWRQHYANIRSLNIQADPFGVDESAMRCLIREAIH